jgi:hypothetical protein
VYTQIVPRERQLVDLELVRATVAGDRGWVQARWKRSDGTEGRVTARFRPRTRTRWYIAQLQIDAPTSSLLRDVPLARIEDAVNADPVIRKWVEDGSPAAIKAAVQRARTPRRHRLKRPASRRLDGDFFKNVGEAYREAVAHGLRPAKTLAEDSNTSQGTVSRWIAEARKRGHLPAAKPGKVSA